MGEHDNEIRRESGREASRETGRRLKYSRIRYRREERDLWGEVVASDL